MIKSELVKALSLRSDLSSKDARTVIDAVFDTISDSLANGHRVELRGFWIFGLKKREARIGRNPKTGGVVDVQPKRVMYFKPCLSGCLPKWLIMLKSSLGSPDRAGISFEILEYSQGNFAWACGNALLPMVLASNRIGKLQTRERDAGAGG